MMTGRCKRLGLRSLRFVHKTLGLESKQVGAAVSGTQTNVGTGSTSFGEEYMESNSLFNDLMFDGLIQK